MPPKRCEHPDCKKRVELATPDCLCKKSFCWAHRGSYDHPCSFDYRAEHTRVLLKTMSSPVIADKMEKV